MTAAMTTGHAPIGADVLSRAELIALADCEQRIETGLKTFIEVGMALGAIQQNRLYRAQFDTFEEYCAARWGFTGRRGRQLIEAAAVGTIVPVENEGQARALAAVPEAERAEVLAEARERTGGKTTAKAITEVAKERAEPKPTQSPEPAAADPSAVAGSGSDLTAGIERALTSAGHAGMTAWQLAFLIDPAGPDSDRAELTVRMAPILEQLAAERRARVVGEVDGGQLWAFADPSWPSESELKPWETLTPEADRVAESMEPVVDDPRDRTHGAEFEAYDAAEPPTCLGADMDCGRPLPCPDHPRTPEGRIAAVAEVAPEFVRPSEPEPPAKPNLTVVRDAAPDPEQVEAERMETQRVQIVERARRRAPRLVPEIRSLVIEVMSGMNLGETGLVTPQTIADLRELVDALEARMEATQ